MGDAEFAGGGSVSWSINHSDGESCKGHKHGAKGRDKSPKTESGLFVITVTGQEPIIVPVNGTTVRVLWGDLTENSVASYAPKAAKTATRKSAKTKTTKAKTASA
jgi:hypothetical protein